MATGNGGGGRGRPAMRVRTDENVQVTTRTTTIIGKAFGTAAAAATGTAVTKENNNSQTIPTRAMVGKVIGGLRGGARRAALGDISNAGAQPKPVGTKNVENPQRQPLGTIHQQPQHHHHIHSTNPLDDIEDAEIIVIDTPEKPSDSLEDQFTEVDEEFHESRSTMDIDSDDPTTEPDDTDTESTINSKRICVPSTTRHDREELRVVRNNFAEEYDPWDTSMVPDYAEDIFRYMRELEFRMTPNPHYMAHQRELGWHMRRVLIDWLIQVHARFHLLPETLFLTVNIIDRFLTLRNVPVNKLQLVGATAIFIASKYEEITCPSVEEIVFMVDNGYARDEILEAERFMVNMLQFELGWPGPMSFLRRISKADDYDVNTRTLAKYLLEVTVMDERFVASPPSYLAAVAHGLARRMLNRGHWTEAHIFYSGYTWRQMYPTVLVLLDCLTNARANLSTLFQKYDTKKFKRASRYVEEYMSQGHYIEITEEHIYTPDDSPE